MDSLPIDWLVDLIADNRYVAAVIAAIFINGGVKLTWQDLLAFSIEARRNPNRAASNLMAKIGLDEEYNRRLRGSMAKTELAFRERGGKGDGGGAFASATVRDYSDDKLNELLRLAREVANEEWWQVDRLDIWYRAERLMGRLTIDNYKQDITSFYRKMIDITDMSESQVKKIFEQARNLDTSYASSVSTVAENLSAPITALSSVPIGI